MYLRRSFVIIPAAAIIWMACHTAIPQESEKEPIPALTANPYVAPADLDPEALVAYIDKLRSRPKSIQSRPGFAEALLDAAERILAAKSNEQQQSSALVAKFDALAKLAAQGDRLAADKLAAMAVDLRNDHRAEVAREARYYYLGSRLDAAAATPEATQELLAELKAFFTLEPPAERHLRLASGTVRLINSLKDDRAALKAYQEFGELFSKSGDRKVVRYGGEIAGAVKQLRRKMEPIEFEGTALDGTVIKASSYRGKVVLIDFWATWCGPCVAELPNVKAAYDKFHGQGFEIIAISLDTDRAALEAFIEEQQIRWPNLFTEDLDAATGKHPLAVKFDIQAIPTTFLLGRDGKIAAQDVRGEALSSQVEKLLAEANQP